VIRSQQGLLRSLLIAVLLLASHTAAIAGGRVAGQVIDASTSVPLVGVIIVVRSDTTVAATRGTVTDDEGRFALDLRDDSVIVDVSLIGYRSWRSERLPLMAGQTVLLTVPLEVDAIALREITVTPGRFAIMGDATGSRQALSEEEIQTIPQFGEDVFRAVTRLPGVTGNDYSAKFTVRGGEQDEVLVRLDGVELVEPFHLKDINGGALSIVDVTLIGGIDLLTGGFPAEYGDRLSGVFDIRSRHPEPGHSRAAIGLSMMNARALIEGADERRSWLISARRGYLDIVLALMGENEEIDPVYSDVFAKYTQSLSPAHEMQLSLLHSRDDFSLVEDDEDDSQTGYGNTYTWISLNSTLRPNLLLHTTLAAGHVTDDRVGNGFFGDSGEREFRIRDDRNVDIWSLRQDWSWEAGNNHLLKWGADLRRQQARYDYFSDQRLFLRNADGLVTDHQDTTDISSDLSESTIALYAADRIRLSRKLTVELGVRYDDVGHSNDQLFSPRVNLAYALTPNTSVRAAWGLFYQSQGIHQLAVEDGESGFHGAQRSEHRVIGLEHMTPAGIHLRVEAYDKQLSDRWPIYRNWRDDIEMFPELQEDRIRLDLAGGHSRGLELYARRDEGTRLTWWVSYALAQVRDNIRSFGLFDQVYPFDDQIAGRFDQRHTIYADVNLRPTPHWRLSLAWQYRTGWPYTERLMGLHTASDGSRYLSLDLGEPLGADYPAFHRLDARLNRTFQLAGGSLHTFLEVTNLYDHDNVSGYSYWIDCGGSNQAEDCRLFREPDYWFGLLPSLGLSWTWELH
jgi:outer membrane cobalamin receptor